MFVAELLMHSHQHFSGQRSWLIYLTECKAHNIVTCMKLNIKEKKTNVFLGRHISNKDFLQICSSLWTTNFRTHQSSSNQFRILTCWLLSGKKNSGGQIVKFPTERRKHTDNVQLFAIFNQFTSFQSIPCTRRNLCPLKLQKA